MAVSDIVPVPGTRFEETLASGSPDLLREMIRSFAQKMMDAEVEDLCGAGDGEVSPDRADSMELDRGLPEILTPPASPPALHPADPHRPARDLRQDRAETRLPIAGPPALLRPPHQRRADLLHIKDPATKSW